MLIINYLHNYLMDTCLPHETQRMCQLHSEPYFQDLLRPCMQYILSKYSPDKVKHIKKNILKKLGIINSVIDIYYFVLSSQEEWIPRISFLEKVQKAGKERDQHQLSPSRELKLPQTLHIHSHIQSFNSWSWKVLLLSF